MNASETSPPRLRRTWGFRFSLFDGVVLVVFGGAVFGLRALGSSLWWLIAIVAVHFLLFCNVFRVARRREMIWAGLYILNVGFWLLLGRLDWFNILALQLPLTTGIIAWEINSPRYHGIFAERLNHQLDDYLEGRIP